MAIPDPAATGRLRFTKMHGAGNDFVVLDLRGDPALARRLEAGDPALCRALADRHTGVGCDQIMVIGPARGERAVAAYSIRNADGSASAQCGNGARCVAAWLARDGAAAGARFVVESPVGEHEVEAIGDGHYRLALGRPRFEPPAVPLRGFDRAQDRYTLHLGGGPVRFGAVSVGNPHAVIEVDDVAAAPVETLGRALQDSDAFPESANVGFAQVLAPDRVALRVYERGAGETLACGSGACAAAAVLMRRGRVAREVVVSLPGGELCIAWPGDGAEVTMSGPTRFVFDGEWLQ